MKYIFAIIFVVFFTFSSFAQPGQTKNGVPERDIPRSIQIIVHPDTLDFDTTLTGYTVVRDLTIQNNGTQSLIVLDIFSTDLAFTVDTTHFQLSPSDSFLLPVTFLPYNFDFYSGQLFILSDDPVQDTVSVFLRGWGFEPPILYPPFVPSEIIEIIPEGDSLIVDILFTNYSPMYMKWIGGVDYLTENDGHPIIVNANDSADFSLADSNWLCISPDSGTIPPWSSDIIQAKIHGIIGTAGDTFNEAIIWVNANNPIFPYGEIPVEVTVIPAVVGLRREENIHPQTFQLFQNYPNPFNPTTTISYQLPVSSEVELRIYNLLGQRIRTLANTKQPIGTYQTEWDGRDDAGREVASGVYIYQLKTADYTGSRKLLLMK